MVWGLFALQFAKVGEELLPFSGVLFRKSEFKILTGVNPRFICYVLWTEINVYQDGNALNGNVAGFINSSIGREYLYNVLWKYSSLPQSWKQNEWGYTMTIVMKDIVVVEEWYASYPINT
jgi:hypothetical protein